MFRRILRKAERGQVVMISALMLPALLGMAALSVDIGGYASQRRDLQNAADSIALAAAQDLCETSCDSTAAARTTADQYATLNDIPVADITVTFHDLDTLPKVRVQIAQQHNFSFMRVLGVDDAGVSASAGAVKASYGGSAGIVPWAVTEATVNAAPNGEIITMKYDSTGVENGNFGAIRIDGPGSATYAASVRYGSTTYACAASATNCTPGACPGTYPATCAETAPECDGPECSPQTGNMTGNTRVGVDFRMNNTSTTCDTFAETFTGPDSTGKYDLVDACNPWLPGQTCPTTATPCSRRVIIIPVVDDFGNGTSDPLTIQRFALVYLEGYEGTCTGSSCEVRGRFITADISARALAGYYDEEATVHFVRLTE